MTVHTTHRVSDHYSFATLSSRRSLTQKLHKILSTLVIFFEPNLRVVSRYQEDRPHYRRWRKHPVSSPSLSINVSTTKLPTHRWYIENSLLSIFYDLYRHNLGPQMKISMTPTIVLPLSFLPARRLSFRSIYSQIFSSHCC